MGMKIQFDSKLNGLFYKGSFLFAILIWSLNLLESYSQNCDFKLSLFIHLFGACILLFMWMISKVSKKIEVTLIVSTIVMIAECNWVIFNLSNVFDVRVLCIFAIVIQIIVGIIGCFMGKRAKTFKKDDQISNAAIPRGSSAFAGSAYLLSKIVMPYDTKNIFIIISVIIITLIYEYLFIRTIALNV